MRKAVLISIKPKWCSLIASGKKTIEVRKTRPKIELPFKCYIYETRGDEKAGNAEYHYVKKGNGRGKVIGEFVCHNIFPVWPGYIGGDCLTFAEQEDYLGANGRGWGWAISDLVIYDKPKELSEFKSYYGKCEIMGGYPVPATDRSIKRAPQSWMYVGENE